MKTRPNYESTIMKKELMNTLINYGVPAFVNGIGTTIILLLTKFDSILIQLILAVIIPASSYVAGYLISMRRK